MAEPIAPIRPDYDRPNYNPLQVAPYTLEDPLTFANGQKLNHPADWPARRQEILEIFAREMYGQEPPPPTELVIEKFEEKSDALAGFAIRSQFNMYFKKDHSGPRIQWLLFRPRFATTPVPVITLLNFNGNQELVTDPEIPAVSSWLSNGSAVENYRIRPEVRGRMRDNNRPSVIPVEQLIAHNYAILTACYADVSPDPERNEPDPRYQQETFAYTGIFELWGKRDDTRTDNPTALGAWAWALSRGLDLIEQLPELDARKVAVTGCSRLGKAAFLAMARDERFAVGIPLQCGGGGVTLAKRDFGENVATETRMFTHWYCSAYQKYATNPAALLNFDQHLLLAAIAPRPVLVQGFDAPWFDPEGEFLACQAASCAWEFLGKPGLPKGAFPADFATSAIGPYLGYSRRSQDHGFAPWDWRVILDFLAPHFKQ